MQQDAELRTDRWRCGGHTGQGLMAGGDGGVSAVNSPQTGIVRIAQAPVAQAYQDFQRDIVVGAVAVEIATRTERFGRYLWYRVTLWIRGCL